ncbi:hypothetical protein N482_18430 [Pseudoalteromonas luteoviolacea NCIMB 1942]|uniref:Uncharacterized protein n=1 Tax=Pseudoalteromonas luteoviolacea NCIMB 1942 TaxID=1365253 RepID=A0A166Z3V2_9GAMM|nr:hypothetical protein N482_18430 [Pseudoalteromonas luteoviolacea NCIMB 1942]
MTPDGTFVQALALPAKAMKTAHSINFNLYITFSFLNVFCVAFTA